jgi:hypothetical protein
MTADHLAPDDVAAHHVAADNVAAHHVPADHFAPDDSPVTTAPSAGTRQGSGPEQGV